MEKFLGQIAEAGRMVGARGEEVAGGIGAAVGAVAAEARLQIAGCPDIHWEAGDYMGFGSPWGGHS